MKGKALQPERRSADWIHLWRFLKGKRVQALAQCILSISVGFTEAAILTLFARIALAAVAEDAEAILVPALGLRTSTIAFIALGLSILARFFLSIMIALLNGNLQFALSTSLRRQVLDAYSSSSWQAQESLPQGGLQQLLVTIPNSISGSIAAILAHIGNVLIMVAMLSFAIRSDPKLTLFLVFAIAITTALFIPLRRMIKKLSRRVLRDQRSLSSAASELSSLNTELLAFGVADNFKAPTSALIMREGRLARRMNFVKALTVPLYTFVTYGAISAGLVLLMRTANSGLDDVGPILLVVLRSLSYGQSIQQAASAVANLAPSFDYLISETRSLAASTLVGGSLSLNQFEKLEFQDVFFAYDSNGPIALSSVSITISRGERVGIVGPSGGGKSTFVCLLLGLLSPTQGSVLVNGENANAFSRSSWSSHVGVVPQASHSFRGTIEENVRFFRPNVSSADCWNALEAADLADDVRKLPHGIHTMIGPGHRSLSGGQQQRLSIARALVQRPDLLVMDEPTSSIDSVSENEVSQTIEGLETGTTLIIVSHRWGVLGGCDRLIVIAGGRIIGDGDPKVVWESNQSLRELGKS